jgi:hypothetical protein
MPHSSATGWREKGGKECMLRHSGWVAIRPARKSAVVIGSGLAMNDVEVGTPFRHALAASPLSARPVTEPDDMPIIRSDFDRTYIRVIAHCPETRMPFFSGLGRRPASVADALTFAFHHDVDCNPLPPRICKTSQRNTRRRPEQRAALTPASPDRGELPLWRSLGCTRRG